MQTADKLDKHNRKVTNDKSVDFINSSSSDDSELIDVTQLNATEYSIEDIQHKNVVFLKESWANMT